MSRNYDNWERLVAAVLKRQEIWELCHSHSIRTPSSLSSISSDLSSSFSLLNSSLSNASFDFENPKAFQTLAGISIDDFSPDKQKNNHLVFFQGSRYTFSLNELLMASSDVLGEEGETFSRTFVVCPTKDNVKVVVKIFMIDERIPTGMWEKLAKILGMVQNKNVAKLRGYYLSKRAMIGIYDYFHQQSVHLMLHGNGSEDHQAHVNWETRVDIAIGAAHGLAHMHKQYSNKFFMRGNIKASNIFLNSEGFGCFGDLISADFKISGYDPPDEELSQAFDVYNFGILLIELLSGRSPVHYTGKHKTFADWARYEARWEWTALVFDTSILEDGRVIKETLEMLEIALSCLKRKPEERPNMNQVVEMLYILRCEVPLGFFRSKEKILTKGEISFYYKKFS